MHGFDLGETVLALARNKLVLSPKSMPEHYTLHPGPHSKVIEVHKIAPRGRTIRIPDVLLDHNTNGYWPVVGVAINGAIKTETEFQRCAESSD